MKNKYKLIFFITIALLILFPMFNIFAQMGGDDFVKDSFVQNIVKAAKDFEDGKFELKVVDTTKADTSKDFYNSSAVFKLQTDIVINDNLFPADGMYYSALWIDGDGVFDLGEVFYSNSKDGYNPKIKINTDTYKTFYGTRTGKHILISILSKEVPYFGNFYNNQGGMNPIAKKRYIENVENELKDKKASVFITEFDINPADLND